MPWEKLLQVLFLIAFWILSLWVERERLLTSTRRKAELEAGSPERYLEERRAMAAYPLTRQSTLKKQWLLTLLFGMMIALTLMSSV